MWCVYLSSMLFEDAYHPEYWVSDGLEACIEDALR